MVSLWATQAAAVQALALVIPVTQRRGGAPLAGPPAQAGGEAVLARPPGGA